MMPMDADAFDIARVTARPTAGAGTDPDVAAVFVCVPERTPLQTMMTEIVVAAFKEVCCVGTPRRGRDAFAWFEDDSAPEYLFSLPRIVSELGLSLTYVRAQVRAAWTVTEAARAAKRERKQSSAALIAPAERRHARILARKRALDEGVRCVFDARDRRLAKQRQKEVCRATRRPEATPPPATPNLSRPAARPRVVQSQLRRATDRGAA
ncbi:MAG TPA: hypothetical protein VGR62_16860 [Candidatus Binatia bacterium]|jgi:hypothetical protein|nr:hypothetical protein [Candidatus Binatia bacterium]